MDERSGRPATWFSEHSGLLLFAVGSVMVLTALVAGLLLDRSPATTVAILFIGAGMILVGALLPRIAGTIKITPGSIEMAIAERLEATRREAAQRVPGREDEAVARAMKALLAQLPVDTRDAAAQAPANGPEPATPPPAPTADRSPPPTKRSMRGWQIATGAGAVAAVAMTAVLVTTLTLGGEPPDGVNTPPPGGGEQPVPTDEQTPTPTPGPTAPATNSGQIAVGVASVVVVAALLLWLGWRARRVEPSLDDHVPRMGEPQEFARRIVDGL